MSTSHPVSIAVFGAGAIGAWLAALLQASVAPDEPPVTVIARGATLAALQTQGLCLRGAEGERVLRPLVLSADALAHKQREGQAPPDFLVVAVKSQGMAQAARDIAPLLGPSTTVVTAMNGLPWWFMPEHPLRSVDPGGQIAALIGRERVIGAVVHSSCSTEGPGLVRHHFGRGLILGEAQGGPSSRLDACVARFRKAGLDSTASERIQRDIWYKLWGNMTMNPVSALTGATTDRVLSDPLVLGLVSAVMLEAKTVGERIGIPIAQSPQDRHAVTAKLGAFKTSMLQDVEAGRSLELDALIGAVHELGQRVGLEMPHTAGLLGLARLMAQTKGLLSKD